MIRYREISLADLFDLISKGETSDIFFAERDGTLGKANKHEWYFSEFKKYKWFKREVIE